MKKKNKQTNKKTKTSDLKNAQNLQNSGGMK